MNGMNQVNDGPEVVAPLPLPTPKGSDGVLVELVNFYKKFVWLQDEDDYMLLALRTASTFIKERLNSFYHILAAGRTESGKSQLLTALALTSYQGYMSYSMSQASMFRTLDLYPEISLFLEELNLKEDGDVVRLMLAIIDRGRKVTRVVKNRPVEFRIFGGVGFSTKWLELVQEDIRNRSIVVQMVKPDTKDSKPKLDFIDTPETFLLRAKLMGMREEILSLVKASASIALPNEKRKAAKFGRNFRFRDIYNSLLPVASYFGVERKLERILLKKSNEHVRYKAESLTGMIVSGLVRLKNNRELGNPGRITLTDLQQAVPVADDGRTTTNKLLANELRRIGVALKTTHTQKGNTTQVQVSEPQLASLAEEYGANLELGL